MEQLHDNAKAIASTKQMLEGFLSRYQEFVALRSVAPQPAPAEIEPTR